MLPAAKHFDPVMGIDIHIIQPPGPVPPIPVPHPFIGMLIDPMDFVPVVGATVLYGGIPRAIAGTAGKAIPPHIPIGGVFVVPPSNECELFMGSATVVIDGDPAGYLGLPVLSCQSIGMPAPPRMNPKKKTRMKSLMLPTSVVLPIPAGPPVLIGGPPTISMMGMAQKAGMAGLGEAFKRLRTAQQASSRMARASARVRRAANALMDRAGVNSQRARNAVDRAVCTVTGHPVDVATGKVFTDSVDLVLPGPLPFVLERVWMSTSAYAGPFGRGWHASVDVALALDDRAAAVRLADGRYAPFALPTADRPAWNEQERATLRLEAAGYVFEDASGLRHHFGTPALAGGRTAARPWLPMLRQEDRFGNAITFRYAPRGPLVGIVDSAGRRLPVRCDDRGRVLEIQGPHPTQPDQTVTLLSYRYTSEGHLSAARDALGQPITYAYDAQGRLVAETDRLGLTFQFEYEGEGPASRCVHTWGNGGVFERRLAYDLAAKTTAVVDTRGATTRHEWNALGLVTRTVGPLGAEHAFDYDDAARLLSTTGPLGSTTAYAYDGDGRLVAITDPLGVTESLVDDEDGNATGRVDAAGRVWARTVGPDGMTETATDPEGGVSTYAFDARGKLLSLTDPLGQATLVRWDVAGNVTHVRDRTGAVVEIASDALGRVVRRTDPEGGTVHYDRDALGRVVRVRDADGGVVRFRYDAAGNVTEATDALGRTQRFDYALARPGGVLARTVAASGAETRYRYGTEGELVSAEDATGRTWLFEYDAAGRIVAETDVAGRRIVYQYDAADQVVSATDARGNETQIARDALGRMARRTLADGTEEAFTYTPDGRLASAINDDAAVRLVYDATGRLVEQIQSGLRTRNVFDAAGNRVERVAPGGRSVRFEHDAESRLTAFGPDDDGPTVRISRDRLGREVERALPAGLVSQRRYSPAGALAAHRLTQPGQTPLLDRRYTLDAARQIAAIRDSRSGEHRFEHSPDGFLTAVLAPDDGLERFLYDDAGNPPAAPVRLDAAVQADGVAAVRQADGWTLAYDADGNLLSKRNAETAYRFTYNAANRLAAAERDGAEVARFAYDALGRRVRKTTPEREVVYVWDGDVLAEERETRLAPAEAPAGGQAAAPVVRQFVFDGFAPAAVLAESGPDADVFVECDHLGTPRLAVDASGDIVWEVDLDAFGADRGRTPSSGGGAIRFPGQIHDDETGLSYNRFRYYDPETRTFTQADPIGLRGGIRPHLYVPSPLHGTDPLGLEDLDTPGYSVYVLEQKNAQGGYDPFYTGLTNDHTRRVDEHVKSGRLDQGRVDSGDMRMRVVETDLTYGQSRGYEQAYMDHYKTRTSSPGEYIPGTKQLSPGQGNKINSYAPDRALDPTDKRAAHFDSHRASKIKAGCK